MLKQEFLNLRKSVIKKDFGLMNDMQFSAVTTVNGPLLVLAGAGSGKTTVLVNRIACLIRYGDAYNSDDVFCFTDDDVRIAEDFLNGSGCTVQGEAFSVAPAMPWEILAITFTNKAAGELKERISAKLGDDALDIWAGTFHSICGKILRRFADRIDYTPHFTIYDTDDQKKLMKEVMKDCGIDEKFIPVKFVLSQISYAKDKLIDPDEFLSSIAGSDIRLKKVGELYKVYSHRMVDNNAMDFDDMICNTVRLLKENPDVLQHYSGKFRYIMVDEYQDTNHAQYMLVKLLATVHGNLCVVGDDDQSIYKFRGATIENILNFEDNYKDARIIRLEQNYRSTTTILEAANAVISHNMGRKGKTLWTNNGDGDRIKIYNAENEQDEARHVADSILESVRNGEKFSDNVILYRMNAQSRAFENIFVRSGIPYRVIGGLKFYDRKEIKDIIAYLNVINNPYDDLRLKRIINEPKRSIGQTTVEKASAISAQTGNSLYDIFKNSDEYADLSRSCSKLKEFISVIESLRELSVDASLHELLEAVLDKTGYRKALELAGEEEADRLDNLRELASSVLQYEVENDEPTLSGFLEDIALITDLDNFDTQSDTVIMMTIHSAKGLEFNNVYIVGMEEGIFPGNQSIYSGESEIEEERRLAYVALTRAKKKLNISVAYTRMLFGMTNRNLASRFLREIPESLCVKSGSSFYSESFPSNLSVGEKRYQDTAPSVKSTVSIKSSFASSINKNSNQHYSVGQQVEHSTFGVGLIIKVTPMGQDTLLEIAFDSVGTKKLMANFAKLKIV